MDRNTFWSETAPSYETIEECFDNVSIIRSESENEIFDSYVIEYESEEFKEEHSTITIRVFSTVEPECQNYRLHKRNKLKWFGR